TASWTGLASLHPRASAIFAAEIARSTLMRIASTCWSAKPLAAGIASIGSGGSICSVMRGIVATVKRSQLAFSTNAFKQTTLEDAVRTIASIGYGGVEVMADAPHMRPDTFTDAQARELRKLGADVQEREDGLRIIPGERRGAVIETYNDHRMAMSMALVGLGGPAVEITNPGCTAKTYPNYFADLETLRRRG
ncbi:MAG: hypothetical protein KY475_27370, partial [Planctomycetes bacterium]|nr:hypothetical protein [Planctomycetota bacterium]